ncbi:hypothetical protein Tco_0053057 [Tanacetum coccineum]
MIITNSVGSATSNSVMHALVNDGRGKQTHQSQMPLYSQLEGIGSSVGTVRGSTEELGAPPPPRPSQHHHHRFVIIR